MYDTEVTVVGAGVVGLAVAARLAASGHKVLVLEKREGFGLETSSRNSQVIHAGINDPPDSLKARLCVEGRSMLYQLCQAHSVGNRRLGKMVVASTEDEVPRLEVMCARGQANGVDDLRLLTRREVAVLEPNVRAVAALLSPSTGVVDAWALMRLFAAQARDRGATLAFHSEVVGLGPAGEGWRVSVLEPEGAFTFQSRTVVNCAGLWSDHIAALAGIDVDQAGYRLHYCKGEFFAFTPRPDTRLDHLVYPTPEVDAAGLGIHTIQDVEGVSRLGPSIEYVDRLDYQVDVSHREAFLQAARRYLPGLEEADLSPDFAGIRPKLAGPGEGFRDFIIRHEADRGLPGLVNLVGIESPGLTASPAIARHVAGLLQELEAR
ncbi:MAG: NAD(P)/FAD-dependent oxidoreductase [Chloroflexi bacterium]|nr:NAD(P)/FAD-dependent oxidoreductase [Chloroflexota bacterium]